MIFQKNASRLVVLSDNMIPDLYIKKKLYLQERLQLFNNIKEVKLSNSKGNTMLFE